MNLARAAGWDQYNLSYGLLIARVFMGWIYTMQYPAQSLTTAGYDLDDLNHDLPDLSVRYPLPPFTTAL